jgi:hypothetical protein
MNITTVFDPRAPFGSAPSRVFRPLETLHDKVIGFIDNSKPNFRFLADDLAELLTARYGAKAVVRHRKRSASIPAPEATIADVARRCDFVITGSGD